MRMADGEGLRKSRPSNNIHCLTRQKRLIGAKGNSRGLSNRDGPPPEMETAAPTGIGNGGRVGKASSNSKHGIYSTASLAAMGGLA